MPHSKWGLARHSSIFGAEGLRSRLAEHIRLARLFAGWVDDSDDFERIAPVPFSVVCFRRRADDTVNERLLDAVNRTGEVFLSHTRLNGRFVLRLAVGNLHTTEAHVQRAWDLIREHSSRTIPD